MNKVVTWLLQSCENIVYNAYYGSDKVGKWNYMIKRKLQNLLLFIE